MTSLHHAATVAKKPSPLPTIASKELLDRFTKLSQASGGFQILVDPGYVQGFYDFNEPWIQNRGAGWAESVIQPVLDPSLVAISLWSVMPSVMLYPIFQQSWSQDPFLETVGDESIGSLSIILRDLLLDYSGNTLLPTAMPHFAGVMNMEGSAKSESTSDESIEGIESAIIHTFTLSGLDELAGLCGVTRQTLTNWRKPDARPDQKNITRLYLLWDAARAWETNNFPRPGAYLRMPILQGKSLLDHLSFNNLDHDAIRFIGHRLLIKSLA